MHLFSKYALYLHGIAPYFLILSLFTLATIARYSFQYIHQEVGARRYWFLFSFFSMGILLCVFSGNLETFFVGWEMVGLASFFLIGFYQTQARSLENSLIALTNYKMCDIFFVLAIFLEEDHHHPGLAGLCLIIATLAKSAQFPFSSWLYRALEGPTPSSTIFYGGLSLHLGPFLLIQFSHLWMDFIWLRIFMGFVGLTSALYGFFVGATRSDLKTSFAFASISQVGLIFIELALGFPSFALWHLVGHNMIRSWNYLRAGSFYDDFFKVGNQKSSFIDVLFRQLPNGLFIHAFNGFYLDWIFNFIRNFGLITFLSLSTYFVGHHIWWGTLEYEYLLLFMAMILSAYVFIIPAARISRQFIILCLSQLLIFGSIQIFYADLLEEAYLGFSLLFLAGAIYALLPAMRIWLQHQFQIGDHYLGLKKIYPRRHWLYLISAICLTASPGSLQFFLQENLFGDLWNRSHLYMVLALVCLTLNSVNFFKIGQTAFFGDLYQPPVNEMHPANS